MTEEKIERMRLEIMSLREERENLEIMFSKVTEISIDDAEKVRATINKMKAECGKFSDFIAQRNRNKLYGCK